MIALSRKNAIILTAAAAMLVGFPFLQYAKANDKMFPPLPSAENAINIDGKGFIIDGKRTFIVSAGLEYARIPRELWRDRLLRLQRGGFNCVEIYTFWNYHEAQPGQFDFSGNRDIDAFLKLANSLGLYAIVRVGPYYCAEWDSGGYPIWLRFQQGLTVRNDNEVFEQDVARWWAHLLPIVAKNQISRGGNVILVQLENEHPQGWGTDGLSNPYFQFLQKTALADGIDVPYFFSGLHHGSEPGGSGPGSNEGRSNPWFSTEFWCDWYDVYGENEDYVIGKDRATWKILAYGGNGYNYYMADGGSNFDYFNNNEDVSSYDYGAAVGEGGDLRPEYYKFKRAAWFARSFQDILENDNGASARQDVVTNQQIAVSERQGPAGAIYFLDNSGNSSQQTQITVDGTRYPQSGPLTLNAHEIAPVVTGYSVTSGVTLSVAPCRVLGIAQQANTTTIIIYGQSGSPAEVYFNVPAQAHIVSGSDALSLEASGRLTLKTTFSDGDPGVYTFTVGDKRVRILALSDKLADKTWLVSTGAQSYIVIGPDYVSNAVSLDGRLRLSAETPWLGSAAGRVLAYGPSDKPINLAVASSSQAHPKSPALGSWQTLTGTAPTASNYAATGWLTSNSGPQQMGTDGDVSCYAWYRTKFTAPDTGPYVVSFGSVGDRMIPYVDGAAVPAESVSPSSFTVDLTAGAHSLAVFTAHYGRDKAFNYIGPLETFHTKGLTGPVRLQQISGQPSPIDDWKTMPTTASAVDAAPPASNSPAWSDYTVEKDAFGGKKGYAWFQTTLPADAADGETINFSSVDDNAWVYLNGTKIAAHEGWNVPFQISLSHLKAGGANVLSVLVQNTDGTGGIDSAVNLVRVKFSTVLNDWTQHGGTGNPDAATGWKPFNGTVANGPQFFKTTFSVPIGQSYPIWRIVTTGLSRGSVWVNGHNLGRYPQNTPAPGVYVPECWLVPGKNTLVVFDENGATPDHVEIQSESAASRDIVKYESKL